MRRTARRRRCLDAVYCRVGEAATDLPRLDRGPLRVEIIGCMADDRTAREYGVDIHSGARDSYVDAETSGEAAAGSADRRPRRGGEAAIDIARKNQG